MNLCILIGKIASKPQFDFLYKNSRISISYFDFKLENNNIVKVFGYDEKADEIYRNYNLGDIIIIEGKIRLINKKIEIEVNNITQI